MGWDTASQDNEKFSEIWVLKLRVYRCIIKLNFTHKNPNFAVYIASSRIPDFSYGLCSIIRAEAVSTRGWEKLFL